MRYSKANALICFVQELLLERIRPKCLWFVGLFIIVSCIKREGGTTGFDDLREKIIGSVLLALNATRQEFAQSEIVFR